VSGPGPISSTKVLALDRIKVPKRRRQTGNVANLAASIQELGLLNPVTLTRDLKLVAGYHRLQACRSLGWKTIPAQVLDLWLRGQTEHCILAVRGRPVVRLKSQSTVLHSPAKEHSKKPEAFYRVVEGLCASTARLELFARTKRPGWVCSGAELESPRSNRPTAGAG
jgi:hypothetical protein